MFTWIDVGKLTYYHPRRQASDDGVDIFRSCAFLIGSDRGVQSLSLSLEKECIMLGECSICKKKEKLLLGVQRYG